MGRPPSPRLPLEKALREGACVPRVLFLLGHHPEQATAPTLSGEPVFFELVDHPHARELLSSFVGNGVALNQRDEQGRSLFHRALLRGSHQTRRQSTKSAWLPTLFPAALAQDLLSAAPERLKEADHRGYRGLLLAMEADHAVAVEWLIHQGSDAGDTHASQGLRFAPWLWAMALPSASVACLNACSPGSRWPALGRGELQFLLSRMDEVVETPTSALVWLEKMAVWEQHGGRLMTRSHLSLVAAVVRAYRRAASMEMGHGKLGFALREGHRQRLLETGYVHRWHLLNAWHLQDRLEHRLAPTEEKSGRERL